MSVHNVVVFGESGSGKSSAVNLLVGRNVAHVSDQAIGCTFQFQKCESPKYNLYDTVGLSEGSKGKMQQSAAVKNLIELLKALESGVSLLIFVMKKDRIKKSLDENYKLFVEAICMKNVPVILLMTGCDMELDMDQWWLENKQHFDNYGMTFREVVMGCTRSPDTVLQPMKPFIEAQNKETRKKLSFAIVESMMMTGFVVKGGWVSWLATIMVNVLKFLTAIVPRGISNFFDMGLYTVEDFEKKNIRNRLYDYFKNYLKYDSLTAKQMADDIADGM